MNLAERERDCTTELVLSLHSARSPPSTLAMTSGAGLVTRATMLLVCRKVSPQRNRSGPSRFSRTVHLDGFTAMRMAVVLAGVLLVFGRPALSQEWTTFVEPQLGTRLELPSDVFTVHEGPSYRGTGEQYKTDDGRAELAVYSQENARHETPRSYLRRHNRAPRGTVDYMRVTRSFFAISALYEGVIYYSRCNFSRGNTIHCFDLKYPASEKLAWDKIVTRISRSLGPLDRG